MYERKSEKICIYAVYEIRKRPRINVYSLILNVCSIEAPEILEYIEALSTSKAKAQNNHPAHLASQRIIEKLTEIIGS